jgi:E3 ubiquitin-protein ligase RNF115/126
MAYWCHTCKSESLVEEESGEVVCTSCKYPFIELIVPEDDHPRHFVPYQSVPSLSEFLSELIMSPAVRSVRYFSSGRSDEDSLDQVIHHLMMNDTNRYGPPPASEVALNSLSEIQVTADLIERLGSISTPVDDFGEKLGEEHRLLECTVCKDEFKVGDQGVSMPCYHLFHRDCITPWLKAHNSCPTCRFELPTEDEDYERMRRGS